MKLRLGVVFNLVLTMVITVFGLSAGEKTVLYNDPTQPVQVRIQDLLDRMIL